MRTQNTRIVLIGCGAVGMSFAYTALIQNISDCLVLVDRNNNKAIGEALDLNHGVALANSTMRVFAGTYEDCNTADIIVITAGAAQKENETRLDLNKKNAAIMKEIVGKIKQTKFEGVLVIAANPVDILTSVALKESGYSPNRVIGSGTTLDTARLKYELASYLKVDPRNVHGYVLGEHGDASFISWNHIYIGAMPILALLEKNKDFTLDKLQEIYESVRDSAYRVIELKGATYYGIGIALARICTAILNDEHSILTVSTLLRKTYKNKHKNICLGVPTLINKFGATEILELDLNEFDAKKMEHSQNTINKFLEDVL